MYYDLHKKYQVAQLFSTFRIKIGNVSGAANQYIRMISERSRDTEDWSNDCWKFSFAITGIKYILKYIKIENWYFKLIVCKELNWQAIWPIIMSKSAILSDSYRQQLTINYIF